MNSGPTTALRTRAGWIVVVAVLAAAFGLWRVTGPQSNDGAGDRKSPAFSIARDRLTSTGPPATSAPADQSRVATAKDGLGTIAVFDSPTSPEPVSNLDASGDYGQRQVFLVTASSGQRVQVRLPIRPNGSTGWIDSDDVDETIHQYRISVSLAAFKLTITKAGQEIFQTAIGVGDSDTPTVGGEFYTWVLIDPTNTGYGAYAYGLSGYSTLTSFAGGDGRMAIHGTTDLSSIGKRISHGCIRIPNTAVVEMVEKIGLPLGVPVEIKP